MIAAEGEYEPTAQDLYLLREWLKKMPHIVQDYGKSRKKNHLHVFSTSLHFQTMHFSLLSSKAVRVVCKKLK